MKTIQEQIAVMQHFAEGGELEFSSGVNWLGCTVPSWNWQTFDYRIKKPVDPYAELKAAEKDPTKQIRCKYLGDWGEWYDAGCEWKWNYPPEHYEIRDKPKSLKKVKFLAWFDGIQIGWVRENAPIGQTWKRVPSEDKEIEVEE